MPSRVTRCLRFGSETQEFRDCLGPVHYISPEATMLFFMGMAAFIAIFVIVGTAMILDVTDDDETVASTQKEKREMVLALRRAGWTRTEIASYEPRQ